MWTLKRSTIRNIVQGVGTVLEIAPAERARVHRHVQSDEEAIRSDWQAVGDDLWSVMRGAAQEVEDHVGSPSGG